MNNGQLSGPDAHFSSFFSVSAYANTLTGQNQACLAAYSTCRKYQDAAAGVIATCQLSSSGLVSRLKSLNENRDLINQAQAAIAQLLARHFAGGAAISRIEDNTYTCSDLVAFTAALAQALQDNPASPKIDQLAMKVVNASRVSCTQEEVAALVSADSDIKETEDQIDQEITIVQDSLAGEKYVCS